MVKIQARRDANAAIDYFLADPQLSEGEKQGVWVGSACADAGLECGQPVSRESFAAVLNGYSPAGELLLAKRQPNRRVAWDVVVTPDKSISIAALCLASHIASNVRSAFVDALDGLLRHFESLAYRQAPKPGGDLLPTGNVLVARFLHEASRHADPHYHGHLLVMNATRCPDRWRSLEPSPLFRHQRALRFVFNSLLHHALQVRGFASQLHQGIAQLPVSRSICDAYSKAHTSIVNMARALLEGGIQRTWCALPPAALLDRLNERSRPQQRPAKPDWQTLLTPQQQNEAAEKILRSGNLPPPPPPAHPTDPPLTILRERWSAVGHDRRRLKQLVASLAAEFPMLLPLGDVAKAATQLRLLHDHEEPPQVSNSNEPVPINRRPMTAKEVEKLRTAAVKARRVLQRPRQRV